MPGRPTKRWWNACVAGVTEKGSAIDPRSVCGSVWWRKPPSEREAIARADEGRHADRGAHHAYTIERLAGGRWVFVMSMLTPTSAAEMAELQAKRTGHPTRVVDASGHMLSLVHPGCRGQRPLVVGHPG